jgi:hypothetical protein
MPTRDQRFEDELESEAAHEGEEFLGGIGKIVGSLLGESEDELGEVSEQEDELGELGELEDELSEIHETESELGEFEDELGELHETGELEDELGGAGEFEDELGEVGELEDELGESGELEGEQFFGAFRKIARGVGSFVKKNAPLLKSIAKVAAPAIGGMFGGPLGAKLASSAVGLLGEQELGELESHELEVGEHESAAHTLHEANGELLAALAARTPRDLDAQAMMGAAAVTVVRAHEARELRRILPYLVRATALLTRILRRRRALRPALRAVPTIVRRTNYILRRRAAGGRPISRQLAGRVMASQVRRVLGNPQRCTRAIVSNVRSAAAVRRAGARARGRRAV